MAENNVDDVQPNEVSPLYQTVTNPMGTIETISVEWAQEDFPGYSLGELLALSAAGLHSSNDQTSTLAKKQALDELIKWLKDRPDHIRAKTLVFVRRLYIDDKMAERVMEGKWSDEW